MIKVLRQLPMPVRAMMLANFILLAIVFFSPARNWSCVCVMMMGLLTITSATALRQKPDEFPALLPILLAVYLLFAIMALFPFLAYIA